MKTLGDLTAAHGFAVLEHLEAEAQVPVLPGLQAQGDLFVIPLDTGTTTPGHEHRLFAGTPATAWWTPAASGVGQDIGTVECTEPAYLLHPEHGATGIAPGSYVLRRQREQADEERLVAD